MKIRKNYNLSNGVYFNEAFSNKNILSRFLTLILNYEIDENEIEYLNDEISDLGKKSVYDIFVKIKGNEIIRIDLEMQNYNMKYLDNRIAIYQARLLNNDYSEVDDYHLHKCKSIWIMNFNTLDDTFINHLKLKDDFNNIKANDIIDITLINLNNLTLRNIIKVKGSL